MNLKAISLYTGAGGLDLGLESAGFETLAAVEMDPDCVTTLRANREWPVIDRSIHEVPSSKLLTTAHLDPGEADLLFGGPPCQPFSKAGYWASGDSRRLDDPRADTVTAFLRVLRDTRPRAFLIGTRDGRLLGNLVPTHRPVSSENDQGELDLFNRQPLYLSAWDAIGDLENDDSADLQLRGKWADLLPSVPDGKNYLYFTERGGGAPLFGWRRRYWNFLLKLSKNQPSWTLTAQPGPATGPFHWESRRLSARELCRLQTIPDAFYVTGTLNAVQRQVGNAVPSALAEMLGLAIRSQLLDDASVSNLTPTLLPTRKDAIPRLY